MHGALALSNGVLYVGRHEATAHVRPYDLDGRPLSRGFSFRGSGGEPCGLAGLAVDEDRHIWIGDRLGGLVRGLTVFGREFATLEGGAPGAADLRGALGGIVDLSLARPEDGDEAEAMLLVGRGGWRRHAVQMLTLDGRWLSSLRPRGEVGGHFWDVRAVASRGPMVYVAEGRPGRIQVFRGGEFHFLFEVPVRPGGRFEPVGLAPVEGGGLVIACSGEDSALLLVDGAGRLIRTLALAGRAPGQVLAPNDVVAEPSGAEGDPRVAAIDLDAERVQVFTLGGRCFGELVELPGRAL